MVTDRDIGSSGFRLHGRPGSLISSIEMEVPIANPQLSSPFRFRTLSLGDAKQCATELYKMEPHLETVMAMDDFVALLVAHDWRRDLPGINILTPRWKLTGEVSVIRDGNVVAESSPFGGPAEVDVDPSLSKIRDAIDKLRSISSEPRSTVFGALVDGIAGIEFEAKRLVPTDFRKECRKSSILAKVHEFLKEKNRHVVFSSEEMQKFDNLRTARNEHIHPQEGLKVVRIKNYLKLANQFGPGICRPYVKLRRLNGLTVDAVVAQWQFFPGFL